MENNEGARQERKARRGKDSVALTADLEQKIHWLLRQGRELYRDGAIQQAIHVWTRILFLDRNNRAASDAIEAAKRRIAEHQRRLDALVLEAESRERAGDSDGAHERLRRVLRQDPGHPEGLRLREKLEERERRGEARSGAVAIAGTPLEDAARRPTTASSIQKSRRRRAAVSSTPHEEATSPLKMAAFLFSALCLFATGALYLHLNWEFLVSVGGLSPSPTTAAEVSRRTVPELPKPGELHYYNGARLYSKGQYRQALSELALVDRDVPSFEAARSLILRIEERLLRSSVMAGAPADTLALASRARSDPPTRKAE